MSTIEQSKLRALVIDDSAFYRKLIGDVLKGIPDVEVVGTAFDGDDCLKMIEKHRPDFVTLDMQMPKRDGLSVLDEISNRKLRTEVIMVCAENRESADQAMQALRRGALDMILKPTFDDLSENRKSLNDQILKQLETVRTRFARRNLAPVARPASVVPSITPASSSSRIPASVGRSFTKLHPACICVGVSTGGPQSLGTLLAALPDNLPIPVFIVQHMPPVFTKSLADHLNRSSAINVSEAVHGEMAQDGHVYIAPGGKHMRIEKLSIGIKIHVTDEAPVGSCKPSVDYLFQSVANAFGGNTLAIILTGMGSDGLLGCRTLKDRGAHIIAQNAETSVVYGMPRQIVENNLANDVLPLNEIASRIVQLTPAPSRQ